MNARVYYLTSTLRAILSTLPGATSISLHTTETWTLLVITTSSDEAVSALGEALGLVATEVRDGGSGADRWWRRVMEERDQDALRVAVVGPHHRGRPPRDA
jgi:hypothetical protein